jgi:guanosine-3',5'-bis(diphosphate) 3'-pyrophosphohydrolase
MAPRENAPPPVSESPVVAEAHEVAAREHAGQRRKANRTSYLSHVVAVAEIIAEAGFVDELVAASLLHDVVEHTPLGLDDIRRQFGERIGSLVEAMTDREQIEDWKERKDEHRHRIRTAGRDAIAIYAADKLCGIREARDGYAEVAANVEGRLGNPLDLRLRAWEEDLDLISGVKPPLPFAEEIGTELSRLRGEWAATPSRR